MKNLKKVTAITMVAGGLVAAGAGVASATDGGKAHGNAQHSPGVASGNNVQIPVTVGANICDNTLSVIGLLNPHFGNKCVTK
ncbi:chaplin [Streptomyces gobiensis]|uniref:chaplin n=1 Tax=Streptomyces gobiensis TaxID=2875706 RepID=UPI001E2CF29C|nr:chaplin [Streptomyces gobiensis]UGY90633.1 chaplin [Streptomyces gobiensis]